MRFSAILCQRHNHVGVGIFDSKDGRVFCTGQLQVNQRFGAQHLQKVGNVPRIKRNPDFFVVVFDRQFDLGFANILSSAGQHQLGLVEDEVDAPALFIRDNLSLSDRRVEGADSQRNRDRT